MLERAPDCVKQGGRRIFDLSRKPFRSRRSLHSAFWSHGAGEIDLPSWWIALLQRPPPERSTARQSIVDTARSYLTAGLNDGNFLDFLYPAKTLTLIHKLAVRDAAHSRHQQRHPMSTTSRARSSVVEANPLALDSESTHAAQLIEAMRALDEIDKTNITISELPRRNRAYDQEVSRLMDQELPVEEDMGTQSSAENLEAFEKLEAVGSQLMKDYGQKIWKLLMSSDQHWQGRPSDYSVGIKALIRCGEFDKAILIYRQALKTCQDHLATPVIIRLALETKNWQLATDAWYAYKETVQSESFFWSVLQDMDFKTLVVNAYELGIFAKKVAHDADKYLRRFTIELIDNVLSLQGIKEVNILAIDHYRLFSSLGALVGQPSEHQYRLAIRQCLAFSFPRGDWQLRTFGETAARYYMTMRERKDLTPDRELLEDLFKRACVIHNVDTELIFNDLKHYHGVRPLRQYKLMLGEHIHRDNSEAYSALLEEIKPHYGDVMTPQIGRKTLKMFARRREFGKALRLFNTLKDQKMLQQEHYNAIVSAYVRVGDIAGAEKWVVEMENSGMEPDIWTSIPILKFYARRGDTEAVHYVIKLLRERGVRLHPAMLEALISSLVQNEDLDAAQELLFEAEQFKLTGTRTYMYNLVLSAFATRRGLDEVETLRSRMQESGVPANEETYAALITALCARRLPETAFNLLRHMRRDKLQPEAYHASIVMGGYLRTEQYDRIFLLYRWMIRNAVIPDLGAKTLLVKAAAMLDQREGRPVNHERDKQLLIRGEEMLNQLLDSSNPLEMNNRSPTYGLKWDSLEQENSTNYFEFLIYIYGHHRVGERVQVLYDKYLEFARKNSRTENDPSVSPAGRMLTALMVYERRAGNHDQVEQLWNHAVEKARRLVAHGPSEADGAKAKVLPSRRFILAVPMVHYMQSLADQDRSDEFDKLFADLTAKGYGIDSKAWNFNVQQKALKGQHLVAFRMAEHELMRDWTVWPKHRRVDKVLEFFKKYMPKSFERSRTFPSYKTLVLLARSYLAVSQRALHDANYQVLIKELRRQAPRTVKAILHMPSLDEHVQKTFL